jgi:nucleoside-diphosphate-sugar epimerase
MDYPAIDTRSNIEGTLNVLALARRAGCGCSCTRARRRRTATSPSRSRRTVPRGPYTPYAISKQVGETYVRSSGLPYAIFRLFNVYGPGDPPGRYRNAIPNMIRALDGVDGCIPNLRERRHP